MLAWITQLPGIGNGAHYMSAKGHLTNGLRAGFP
jgi:hypothetical protein